MKKYFCDGFSGNVLRMVLGSCVSSECVYVCLASGWHQCGAALAVGSCSRSVRQKSAVETRR